MIRLDLTCWSFWAKIMLSIRTPLHQHTKTEPDGAPRGEHLNHLGSTVVSSHATTINARHERDSSFLMSYAFVWFRILPLPTSRRAQLLFAVPARWGEIQGRLLDSFTRTSARTVRALQSGSLRCQPQPYCVHHYPYKGSTEGSRNTCLIRSSMAGMGQGPPAHQAPSDTQDGGASTRGQGQGTARTGCAF